MPPKPKGLSVRDYARHRKGLGLQPWSKSAIQRALQLGYIHRLPGGGIDPEIADEEWHLSVNPAKRHQHELAEDDDTDLQAAHAAAAAGAPPIPPGVLNYAAVRAQREWYQCQLTRLEYLQREKELVTRDSVAASTFGVLRALRNRLQQIPSRVDNLIAVEDDPRAVNAVLRGEIDAALTDLATQFDELDETDAPQEAES